ncbi:ABC transporter permease [Gluconacetobacter tumulisoli]|uniref:ABC transporter permease n=1 Tax=Gluconacetobacter tumulisoli TaxID=1286189 RepID=A0A7W4PM43_9PROT|nr:ABC transporter permease [Gluconacetobacter tumulisoli]MBB2202810.1 ABC transporter permease [Gluconacetobacter tumulisoli]
MTRSAPATRPPAAYAETAARIAVRAGHALLVLWGAFTLTFVLLQLMPGDAVMIRFMDPELGLTPAQIAAIRLSYGTGASPFVQYVHTLGQMLHGNFGYSVQLGVPVSSLLATTLPVTLRLAVCGFVAAMTWTFAVAVAATLLPWAWARGLARALPGLWGAVPLYWSGILVIQVVSFRLHLIPVIGVGPWEGMILPALAVSLPVAAPLAQILLQHVDETANLPFATVARTKGASPASVFWRHIIPNAMLPFLTMGGLVFGELLAGAVVTETVFGLDGVGQLTRQAVAGQDVAVLQAVVMISATSFVTINFIIDLLYPVLNPTLRHRARRPTRSRAS